MIKELSILKNYLLYFLLMILVFIIGVSGVFADTIENVGYLDNLSEVLVEVSYTSSPLPLDRLGQYQLAEVEAINVNVSNYTFNAGTSYIIEFYTSNTPLSYANSFTVVGNGLNNQPVTCSTTGITYDDIHYLNFRFNCSNTVNAINLRIFNDQNNYIMDTGLFMWNYVYLKKVVSGTDTSVLESQNAQIIQGQQDIINNQNENTDKTIESQKVCNLIDKSNVKEQNKALQPGFIISSEGFGITDYININKSKIKRKVTASNNAYMCFYNTNKELISCETNINQPVGDVNIPTNSSYVRFTINTELNKPQFEICRNGNQALNDSITDLNDSLNDDDTDGATSEASEFFNSFTTNTFGLTSIITAPLNLIQSLTSSTCTELHLPLPYLDNKYLDLPCMTTIYQNHFGSFFTMYQTITYGIIAYWVIVRIFNQVKDFKNPEHDEIEVVDL